MTKLAPFCAAVLVALGTGCSGAQAQLFQAPYGPDGTWNLYEVVELGASWIDAHENAMSKTQMGVVGHLVDIVSGDENRMLNLLLPGNAWIGLTDREGMAPATTSGGLFAPQESNTLPDKRTQGWAWTSGASFDYQFWVNREPNDFRGEDAVFIRDDGLWNDLNSGLLEDEPTEPTRQPGSSTDESASPRFPYIIEYPTQSDVRFDNVDMSPEPPPIMPLVLPGIEGGAGFIGVTDFFPGKTVDAPVTSVSQMLIDIESGEIEAGVFRGDRSYTRTDVTDRATNGNGGPVLGGTPFDFPGGGGDDFISVGKGWVNIPEAGTYTVQVHSDDGFALQLLGRNFTANSGGQREGDVLFFPGNTDDTNTFGVVDLPAGPQALNFFMWERLAGAYWEISTAQGDRPSQAHYLAIGDDSVLEPSGVIPVVSLVGDATVANVTEAAGGAATDVTSAREIVLEAIGDGTALVRDDVDLLVIKDQDEICCGRPGNEFFDEAYVWPLNDSAFGGSADDEDNFSSMVTGKLMVDNGDDVDGESLQITIGMFSSDGSQFHISGVDFTAGNGNADLTFKVDGDVALTFPAGTGNSNTLGLIELTEGVEYDFDGAHYESSGDAGYEIWAALGDHLDSFDTSFFVPLSSTIGETIVPGNKGWALIDAVDTQRGDYNNDGRLDADDLDLQSQAMQDQDLAFDENHDGTVDRADRELWVNERKNTWMGDADLNGEFDSSDFVLVFAAGHYENGETAGWAAGDWNGDLAFDSSDFVAAFDDSGYELGQQPGGPNPATVPEPSGVALVLISLVAGTLRVPFASAVRRSPTPHEHRSRRGRRPAHS